MFNPKQTVGQGEVILLLDMHFIRSFLVLKKILSRCVIKDLEEIFVWMQNLKKWVGKKNLL
jgi:hypothetical protein